MKIETGNFGNQIAQIGATHIERPEFDAVNKAKMQSAQTVGEATVKLGQVASNVGAQMVEKAQRVADLNSQLAAQQYEAQIRGVHDSIDNDVRQGRIDSSNLEDVYKQRVAAIQRPEEITDLSASGQLLHQKRLDSITATSQRGITTLKSQMLTNEEIQKTDQVVAGLAQRAFDPAEDLNRVVADLNSQFNRPETRAALGKSLEVKKAAALHKVFSGHYNGLIEANRGDSQSLEGYRREIQANPMITPDDKINLFKTIDGKQQTLATRQAAAEARQLRQQEHAEHVAEVSTQSTLEFISKGGILSDDALNDLQTKVQGTSQAARLPEIMGTQLEVQKMRAVRPDQQEAYIQGLEADAQRNGSNPDRMKILNNLRSVSERDRQAVSKDPITHMATLNGMPVPEVNFDLATPGGNMDQRAAATGTLKGQIDQLAAISSQAKQLYGQVASNNLFTDAQAAEIAARATSGSATDNATFLNNLRTAAGSNWPAIQQQLSKINPVLGSMVATPDTVVGKDIAEGAQIMNPKQGKAINGPSLSSTSSSLRAYTGLMGVSTLQSELPAVNAAYVARMLREGKNPEDSKQFSSSTYNQALKDVLGVPVSYGNSQIIAPRGMNESRFLDRLDKGFQQLGQAGQDIQGHLKDGTYKMVRTSGGNYQVMSASNRPIKLDDKTLAVFNFED
ncbi:hypothetical protein BEE12_16085 [Pantoea agglomerans]|uniref:hypothetical protein n=1 Tax=Enterobacter agglomerans TaxID=549 RepID=UPI00083DDAF6|nr:hypothetical protein [Pantoea agglomerans]AOE41236.1 hypothetical protein BEE12_16085 [Pantoea agglomerans]